MSENMDSDLQSNESLLNLVKGLGVAFRHPHDPFFKTANDVCQPSKPYGIYDHGDEDFFHKPYFPFACHIPGCTKNFETVMQFEAHYNSCHCFTCKECNKNLPNNHLLDLHLSETHDSYFLEMAKRKPMFQCFVQECKELFNNPRERHNHCTEVHKFPPDFRFDIYKKGKIKKEKCKTKATKQSEVQSDENFMDTSTEDSLKSTRKKNTAFKGFTFGHFQARRKPIFHDFSKDLLDSLPKNTN